MTERISSSKVRDEFSEALNRVAYQGSRIVLNRRGKDVAALVPIEDLKLLEELEERMDLEEAERRLDDPNEKPVPYESVRKEMGLA